MRTYHVQANHERMCDHYLEYKAEEDVTHFVAGTNITAGDEVSCTTARNNAAALH
jgi:hypothetical protein